MHPRRRVGSKITVSLFQEEQNDGGRSGWLEFFGVSDRVRANPTTCVPQPRRLASAAGLPPARCWDVAPQSFTQHKRFLRPSLNLCHNHLWFEPRGDVAEKCRGCIVGFPGSRRDPAVVGSRGKARLTLEGEWKQSNLWSCLLF